MSDTVKVVLDTKPIDEMIINDKKRLSAIIRTTAFRILADARKITPRDPARPPKNPKRKPTGSLRANSDVVIPGDGLMATVEYYQEYAPYQELGAPAINLPARPFLTPAVEKNAKKFEADIAKAIEGK